MPLYILILTNLASVAGGAALSYFFTIRYLKVVEHEGHPAIEIMTTEERVSNNNGVRWPGMLGILVGLVAVIIGVQTYQGKQAEEKQDKSDKAFVSCIANYSQDGLQNIVDTIMIRSEATAMVEKAKTKRDNAVDDVIKAVALSREVPARATEKDFYDSIAAAREAKRELRETKQAAEIVKDNNEYEVEESKCSR